ncbi:NADAR family protein [Brevibacillus sp. MER 51]|uniref:NADAR family protein n=1 Tax=Brevibacillus sp. MER 51 TaxID=2939560 RepID=UPI0020425580|nr:NADAR family protein [Brevibacillus sp. MER 51]MCM3143092.1 NADAR family protein [Brevibacillus sp. MER 51]
MQDHIRKHIQQPLEIHFDQPDKPYGCFSNFSGHPIELEGEIWTTLEHYLQAKKVLGTALEKEIMRKALQAKVEQYPVIREILLSTGDAALIDRSSNDPNLLGKLWMEVRESLDGYQPHFYLPPWIEFPEEHPYSLFWRMGFGEDYVMHYWPWLEEMSVDARNEYDAYFPVPEEWQFEDFDEEEE